MTVTKLRSDERHRLAVELVDDAEALVQAAERAVEGERDPTLRDVRETELRATLVMQDEIAETVAPAIDRRQREVADAALAAVRSLQGAPSADWTAKHRRWHSPAVKAKLVGALGAKTYMRAFPW
jgi:hypothetical protein